MVKVVLQAHGGSMTLETDAAGWCRVFLQMGNKQVPLGADRSEIVPYLSGETARNRHLPRSLDRPSGRLSLGT